MTTEKLLAGLMIIHGILVFAFEIVYFQIPYWIMDIRFPTPLDAAILIRRLLTYASFIFIVVSIIKMAMMKAIWLVKTLRFPMHIFTVSQVCYYLVFAFSQQYSFFSSSPSSASYVLPMRFFSLLLLFLIGYYHLTTASEQIEKVHMVGKTIRFRHWVIDTLLIIQITAINFGILQSEMVVRKTSFYVPSFELHLVLNLIIYYFVSEFLFLQTIGKLTSGSVIAYENGRFSSILGRTAARLIPFDALSFLFGKKGWHDALTKTTVVKIM